MTTPAANRDLAPLFHLGAGLTLLVGLSSAQSFGLCDFGEVAGVGFPLVTAFIFFVGQPRGRRGWLVAVATVMLAFAVVGIGRPAIIWMVDGETGLTLLAKLAGIAVGLSGTVAVRTLSEPPPERSPTNPAAWKPISRWGVLLGLAMGAAAFAATLSFWNWWVDFYPEFAAVGLAVAVLQAFLAGLVAAMAVIWCRPEESFRSSVSSALVGVAMVALTEASILGGTALVQSLAPDRSTFQAIKDTLVFVPVLILPAVYAATWSLGRRAAAAQEAAGETDQAGSPRPPTS